MSAVRHPPGWYTILVLSTAIGLVALALVGPYLLCRGTLVRRPLRCIAHTARYHADLHTYGEAVAELLHPEVASQLRDESET